MRGLLIAGLGVAAVVALLFVPPIPQDPAYHNFADHRAFLGIPNFLDVVSNLPFVVVGVLGLTLVARGQTWEPVISTTVFTGIALTAAGSAYYHLAPDNTRLFWDRLPISVVAASLLSLVIADRIGPRTGRRLLGPLVAASAASVLYWALAGDLRFYGLAQYFPLLAVPVMVALYPPRYTRSVDLLWVGALYVLAKIFEHLDAQIFALGSIASGHTLKHLTAGLAAWWMLRVAAVRPAS